MKIEEVRAIRITNHIKQGEFADLIGVPWGTWSNVELGRQPFYKDVQAKAVQALKELGCDFSVIKDQDKVKQLSGRNYSKGMKKERVAVQKPVQEKADERYNVPKEKPTVPTETVDKVISETEIYRRVRSLMRDAQRNQVAYGIEKYPVPLNADVWTMEETIDHIISETMDKLHYLMMLKIKLEQKGE